MRIEELRRGVVTDSAGRFVFAGVPAGTYTLRVRRISYRATALTGVEIRPGRRTTVTIPVETEALGVEPLVVEARRVPLIEPEVVRTHHVVLDRELRSLPVETAAEAVELATGVSDGRFRGGRRGHEVHVVDGLVLKNQLEGSSEGLGLEFSPTALREIDVTTGGLGADVGATLAGAVSYVTRRGNPVRWEGAVRASTDHWAPRDVLRGFTGLSLSAGGPVPFLGEGSTLFADVLAQGLLDADPRARGLTCLEPGELEGELAARLRELRDDPETRHLACPYAREMLPHQEGDRLIAFLRADRPLGPGADLTATVLRNRFQRRLYTPEFKYDPRHQLGRRLTGTLATVTADWAGEAGSRSYHLTARAAGMRLDRHLGVVDPDAFAGRLRIGGFGPSGFEFLGEGYVRSDIEEQVASGRPVPGYERPAGSAGSPFGPGAEGLFVTEGTPGIASWSRSDLLAADVAGELVTAAGNAFRAGASGRFYRVESYERTAAYLPGSLPIYARFHPATVAGFGEMRIRTGERLSVSLGLRVEAFRSDLSFRRDRANFLSPELDPGWKVAAMPRVGFAGAFGDEGEAGRTSFRFSFSRVAQPPDFRYFLDTTLGDSLRTDIRRQGNPNLAFERGRTFEIGVSHLMSPDLGVTVTAFRKELTDLVTGALRFSGVDPGTFTTGDEGTVQGIELGARGRWRGVELRLGYALQKATGLTSGAFDEAVDPEARLEEFPLAFDRRHAIDVSVYGGTAAGSRETSWGGALTGRIRSGFPLDRLDDSPARLPWTAEVNLRVTRELGSLPGCAGCRVHVVAGGRNVLARENVIALRRDSGGVGPPREAVEALAALPPGAGPIPLESARYARGADLDGDGVIAVDELRTARFAAVLDRNDPSLFFGRAPEVRLGVEVVW